MHTTATDWFYKNLSPHSVIGLFALLQLIIHLPVLHRYGFHADELYFIACGAHAAFGYVDHPPLVPWIAHGATTLFGVSIVGLRLAATLAGTGAIVVTGLLVRRLGGGRVAQAIACFGMLIAPVFLRATNMLSIAAFEPLFWTLASYLLVRIIQEENPRLWLWLGLVVGIGLLNKHSMFFFVCGMLIGMLATPLRRQLRSPWFYAGGGLALLVFLPNLIWQFQNGWPTVAFVLRLNKNIMTGISPLQFLAGQLLYLHPLNALLWISGLLWFFLKKDAERYRIFGWMWVTVLLILILAKSKIYYFAPAYPVLFAGGALLLERQWHRWQRRWLRGLSIAIALLCGASFFPLSVPLLPIDTTERYIHAVSFGAFRNIHELTGDLRDMFGWEERVRTVAGVYASLSEEERSHTVLWGRGYGIPGAIDFLGRPYGLPGAVSTTLSYWQWWTPEESVSTVLAVGFDRETVERVFQSVVLAEEVPLEKVNPWDTPFRIWICREPREALADIWRRNRPW